MKKFCHGRIVTGNPWVKEMIKQMMLFENSECEYYRKNLMYKIIKQVCEYKYICLL